MVDRKKLLNTILADLKYGLRQPAIVALIGVAVGMCIDNWEGLRNSINNPLIYQENTVTCIFYFFFNAVSFGGVFSEYFVAIMAAIPFSASYCVEMQGGMTIYKIARAGKREYVLSKFVVVIVLGGMTLLLGGLLFILFLSTYLPLVTPQKLLESEWIPFYDALISGNGISYFVIVLYLMFLAGALWGSVGLCVSAFFPNHYVAICAPFVIRFLIVQVGRLMKLPNSMRIDRLLCARGTFYSDSVTLIVTTLMVLVLISICYRLFSKRVERRMGDAE